MPTTVFSCSAACRVLLALVTAAAAYPARAQLAVDRSEVLIRPSLASERVGLITVTNTGAAPVQALVKLEDWDRSADGGNRWYPVGSVAGSCGSRLTVFPMALSLDAGATQTIRLTLSDSVALPPRECWSAVMLESLQPPAQRNGVAYLIRTAVKIYVQPEGLRSAGEVTDMAVVGDGTGSDSIEVWFRNTGDKHYVTTGAIEFRRVDNSLAARTALPEFYILPGAHQRARAPLPRLEVGEYIAIAMIDFGGDDIAAMQIEYVVRQVSEGKR